MTRKKPSIANPDMLRLHTCRYLRHAYKHLENCVRGKSVHAPANPCQLEYKCVENCGRGKSMHVPANACQLAQSTTPFTLLHGPITS